MRVPSSGRPPSAAVLGWLSFLFIGWAGLLVASLIRQIEAAFGQTDAGMGLYFFVNAAAYGAGVLGGTELTHRFGRQPVLAGGIGLGVLGLVILATAPGWGVFLLAALPFGVGCGALDGAANGLILDLYPTTRGRSLNLLHFFFSAGALASPFVVGRAVEGGVPWQGAPVATAIVSAPIAIGFARAAMPSGRTEATESGEPLPRLLFNPFLVALGIAIACYVACEIGISNWLVRFLAAAPLSVATTALTLYWGGLTVGRLVSARIGDRFDHTAFAAVASVVTAIAIGVAVIAPTTELSIAAFAVAGLGCGPIFPLVVAVGGERFPDRSAAVGGYLATAAVVGGVTYPPIMGLLSVTVGLSAARVGTGMLALACGIVLLLVGRPRRRAVAASRAAG